MAYWGYQTKANFAVWIIVSVCFVTGITWMAWGANDMAGCKWCKDNFVDDSLEEGEAAEDGGCLSVLAAWRLMEPQDVVRAVRDRDVLDSYYSYCVNSGPLAATIGGAIPAAIAVLLTIFHFPFAKKPQSDAPTKVVPV